MTRGLALLTAIVTMVAAAVAVTAWPEAAALAADEAPAARGAAAPAPAHADATTALAAASPSAAPEAPKLEELARGRQTAGGLHQNLAFVDKLMRQAARTGEAYRIDCAARRHAAARVMVTLGDGALAAAERATHDGDGDESEYQLSRLTMLGDKMRSELHEAHLCVEDDLSTVEITKRDTEVSPGIPAGDPTMPAGFPSRPLPTTQGSRPH